MAEASLGMIARHSCERQLRLLALRLHIRAPTLVMEAQPTGAKRRARKPTTKFRSPKPTSGSSVETLSCLLEGTGAPPSPTMERSLLVRICCVNPSLRQPLAGG
jgi:hypothetical protein